MPILFVINIFFVFTHHIYIYTHITVDDQSLCKWRIEYLANGIDLKPLEYHNVLISFLEGGFKWSLHCSGHVTILEGVSDRIAHWKLLWNNLMLQK